MIRLTNDLILAGLSDVGGITRQQVECLGVEYPPKAGWKTKLIGTEISEEKYNFFVKLKNSSKKMQKKTANTSEKQQNLDLF